MHDRIFTATSDDGAVGIAAGRLTDLVSDAQRRHALAPTAAAALGRLLVAAALLGASLKGRERVSLQISADGPLKRLFAEARLLDAATIGVRGFTNDPAVDLELNDRGKFDVARAVGRGYLQVTRSFEVGQPYVGMVPLETGEIGEDVASYLANSQQIPSVVALGVLANPAGIVAGGGIIAQVMPSAAAEVLARLESRANDMVPVTQQLVAGGDERTLAAELLGRVPERAPSAFAVTFACRCSRERVELALMGLGKDELSKMAREQPETEAICDVCRQRYVLSSGDVERLADRLASAEA